MDSEVLRRARYLANLLTDPTSKKSSFYCTMRQKAQSYGEALGLEVSVRKATLCVWVEEYLISVFAQELPIREEKALIRNLHIINFIMENKLPDYCTKMMESKSPGSISGSRFVYRKEIYGNKAPRRSPKD